MDESDKKRYKCKNHNKDILLGRNEWWRMTCGWSAIILLLVHIAQDKRLYYCCSYGSD